jgi:hypothetical protein
VPRGLLTAAVLVGIALTSLATLRKLERERRLLRKLRSLTPSSLPLDELSEDERDAARSLAHAGVVTVHLQRLHLKASAVAAFRRKRVRLALSGAFAALLLACLVAILILRH